MDFPPLLIEGGGDNLDFQKLDGAPSIPCSTMENIAFCHIFDSEHCWDGALLNF